MSKVSKIYHVKHYDMIVRNKIYVFTKAFLAIFPLGLSFWPAQLMFCIICFRNKNCAVQNGDFIGEYCGEYFL